jgi:hypothetical protein
MSLLLFQQVLPDRLREALGWSDHLGLTRSAEQSANAAVCEFMYPDYQLIAPQVRR